MDKPDSTLHKYDPERLLNTISHRLHLRSDAALAKKLNIAKTVLSAIRRRQLPISGSFLLWIHQVTGMQIAELRELMGDRRRRLRCARGPIRFSNANPQ